jgi:hypothetical protein
MTIEEIAKEVIEKHEKTINWDEGCIYTLEENINIALKKYADQQTQLLKSELEQTTLIAKTKTKQVEVLKKEVEKLKEISNALVDELEGTTKTDFTFRIIDIARKLLTK